MKQREQQIDPEVLLLCQEYAPYVLTDVVVIVKSSSPLFEEEKSFTLELSEK
jgi:hypothetical protein